MSTVVSTDSDALRSKSSSTGDDEKTIPFLRRLRDMLCENEEVVSFYPGSRSNEQTVLGRMVVHDRARVEAEVLPRYFNHASFASLRRQLNYFSFTRLGKGRQRGATYCNEGVVELDDILSLKRRPAGAAASRAPSPPKEEEQAQVQAPLADEEETWLDASKSTTANAVVPFVHLPPAKKRKINNHPLARKRSRFFKKRASSPTAVISPLNSNPTSEDELAAPPQQQVILDLTNPSTRASSKRDFQEWKLGSAFDSYQAMNNNESNAPSAKDEDLMAGCAALLSFSNEAMRLAYA